MSTRRAALAAAISLVLVVPPPAAAAAPPGAGPTWTHGARGAAATPAAAPATPGLQFGLVEVGGTSPAQDAAYTNATGSPATVTVGLTGGGAGQFLIVAETCTQAPVPAGAGCTASVAFRPTAEGAMAAVLRMSDGTAILSVALDGTGVLPEPAVTWGGTRAIGPYVWTEGAALARTVSGTTSVLHAVVQAYDEYDPTRHDVVYRRSTGGAWSARRVNPATQIGGRSAIAAAAGRVYVVWSSFARPSPSSTQPRVVYLRSAGSHGAGTWGSIRRLSPATGRVDYPRVAASGSSVYVTWTNAATGTIKLKISHDRGATWRTVSLGTVTRTDGWGRSGRPAIAVSRSTVAVAWLGDAAGTVRFRRSSDGGASWSAVQTLGAGAVPGSAPSIAISGSRTAVAWVEDDLIRLRLTTGAGWQPARAVTPSVGTGRDYAAAWNGQVALQSTTRVGVAFEACYAGCSAADPADAYRSEILWRESADNGATWARSQVVVATGVDDYLWAYSPSVVWASAATRYVIAGRYYAPNRCDNVPIRVGTGLP